MNKQVLICFTYVIISNLFLYSCSHTPILYLQAPKKNILTELKNHLNDENYINQINDDAEKFAFLYLMAKSKTNNFVLKNKESCEILQDLSEEKSFALKDLAIINSIKICEYDENEIAKINQKPNFFHEKLDNKKIETENNLPNQDLSIYAKDLEKKRNYTEARKIYFQLFSKSIDTKEKLKWLNSIRLSYKQERNKTDFILKTYEMEKYFFIDKDFYEDKNELKIKINTWIDTKIILARALWTENDTINAKKQLHELLDFYKFSNLADQDKIANTYFILGLIEQEQKNFQSQMIFFNEAIKFKIQDLKLKENIHWSMLWSHFLNKKYDQYIQLYNAIIKQNNTEIFNKKIKFWKAVSLQKSNKKNEADLIFLELKNKEEFDFYGLLSNIYLKENFKPIPKIDNFKITKPNLIPMLDWLIAVDEIILSKEYFKKYFNDYKIKHGLNTLIPYFFDTKWYDGAIVKFRDVINNQNVQLLYPTPYNLEINQAKNNSPVSNELIYSIIKQESHFDVYAKSNADAYGLMQLTPETASVIAKENQLNYENFEELYNPQINILLGSNLLKKLYNIYPNEIVKIIASYNAGIEAVKNWEQNRNSENLFEFIESIPYEETRNYVKNVLKNIIIYKRIQTEKDFQVEFDLSNL